MPWSLLPLSFAEAWRAPARGTAEGLSVRMFVAQGVADAFVEVRYGLEMFDGSRQVPFRGVIFWILGRPRTVYNCAVPGFQRRRSY